MIEKDTVKLLRECDAGARMGVNSIDDTLRYELSEEMRRILEKSRKEHARISKEIEKQLNRFEDEGKSPPIAAEIMSGIKTNFKLVIEDPDHAAADLMTDGCNMGIKSLSKYLNKYAAADEYSKDIAKKLIAEEEHLASDLRAFL